MTIHNKTNVIRPLRNRDFEHVSEIYERAHIAEYLGEVHAFQPHSLNETPALMELFKTSEIYVFDQDKIKGFIGHQDKHITWLYVDPAYQGQKVGRALVDFVLTRLNGIAVLSVIKTNKPAVRLYQSMGFRVNGEYDADYQGRKVATLVLVAGF